MLNALKLAAEAFARRNLGTGLNSYDAQAFTACRAAVHAQTGEVLDVRTWSWVKV